MKYLIQFKHPDSTPQERKWWYYEYESNPYLDYGNNLENAMNEGKFWFAIKCLYATPNWYRHHPDEYLSEIREVG